MQVKIHWPNGDYHTKSNFSTTGKDTDLLVLAMRDVLVLSMTYDVIIDNGVITFVDKE
jgi:hypothetical protein